MVKESYTDIAVKIDGTAKLDKFTKSIIIISIMKMYDHLNSVMLLIREI